jgi:hypothetical protein
MILLMMRFLGEGVGRGRCGLSSMIGGVKIGGFGVIAVFPFGLGLGLGLGLGFGSSDGRLLSGVSLGDKSGSSPEIIEPRSNVGFLGSVIGGGLGVNGSSMVGIPIDNEE